VFDGFGGAEISEPTAVPVMAEVGGYRFGGLPVVMLSLAVPREGLTKHYWNGKQGRPGRRDIFVRSDGSTWQVEQRAGGAEGISEFYERPDGESTNTLLIELLGDQSQLQELSG
jgi:hypothetical protein